MLKYFTFLLEQGIGLFLVSRSANHGASKTLKQTTKKTFTPNNSWFNCRKKWLMLCFQEVLWISSMTEVSIDWKFRLYDVICLSNKKWTMFMENYATTYRASQVIKNTLLKRCVNCLWMKTETHWKKKSRLWRWQKL